MANIVYYLGAGASANALPVVGGMKKELELFIEYLLSINPLREPELLLFKNEPRPSVGGLPRFRQYSKLLEESIEFETPDTFAKFLYLNERKDDYELFKEVLVLYFVLRQVYGDLFNSKVARSYFKNNELYRNDSDILEGLIHDIQSQQKNVIYDKRYLTFLVSVLNKSNGGWEFPSNLKIISWNYDSQFEFAFSYFIHKQLKGYHDHILGSFGKEFATNILRLNGKATIKNIPLQDTFKSYIGNRLNTEFKGMIKRMVSSVTEISHELEFAWEKNSAEINSNLANAKNIIADAEILVIIGYSFPVFNREVDFEILSQFMGRKVYLQSCPDTMKEIRSRLVDMTKWDPKKSRVEIEEIDTTDQFYIPFQFHRKEINLFK